MKRSIILLAAFVMALAMQSCKDSSLYPIDNPKNPPTDNPTTSISIADMLGKTWRLKAFRTLKVGTVEEQVVTVPEAQVITLVFNSRTELGGQAICNTYSASVTEKENYGLAVGSVVSTKAYCGADKFDDEYLGALQSAASYSATSESLTIFYYDQSDGRNKALDFTLKPVVDPGPDPVISIPIADMLGKTWRLKAFRTLKLGTVEGGAEVVTVPDDQVMTLTFNSATQLSGDAVCNAYGAEFVEKENYGLALEPIIATEAYCGVDKLDGKYLQALQVAASYSATAQSLTIFYYDKSDGQNKALDFALVDDQGGNPIEKGIVIRIGSSFGMCVGYCWKQATFSGTDVQIAKRPTNPAQKDQYPDIISSSTISQQEWDDLVAALDMNAFSSLDPVIGCPDCADQGAEWIQIERDNGLTVSMVTFEYGADIPQIGDFLQKLRVLRDRFLN